MNGILGKTDKPEILTKKVLHKKSKKEKKVMRKRKLAGGIVALCLALSVAGCGKSSEEKQAANYYQKELGLDKEEAEDLAHELYGKDKEEEERKNPAPRKPLKKQ